MKAAILLGFASLAMAFPTKPVTNSTVAGFRMPFQFKVITPKIVGGSEAIPHSAPHQVSIQAIEDGYWFHNCGGSIVAPDKIISAAHCFLEPGPYRVVAGDHDLTVNEGTEQVIDVASYINHPNFDEETVDYDYAIVRLSKPLSYNANVGPISLPSSSYVPSGTCVNTGWGNTRGDGGVNNPAKLQQVTLPLVDRGVCFDYYDGINDITSRMICAGRDGQGPCKGDSGGPLVCNDVLAGIVSWGVEPCAQHNFPGIYSNVALAVNWFNSN